MVSCVTFCLVSESARDVAKQDVGCPLEQFYLESETFFTNSMPHFHIIIVTMAVFIRIQSYGMAFQYNSMRLSMLIICNQ